ncbi:MAG: tetratricopeptide repeat protein [Pseudonocardiaceae bacterium]
MTSFDHGDELWSPGAAALLNLTGLGLGYAYLRHWWRAGIYLAATIVLVVVAFVTEAANHPWLWRALIVAWLGWMVLDGWRLGRGAQPHPPTPRSRRVPAVVGVVLVVAMVAGYLLYGAAGRRAYAAGLAAQSRADCASAIMKYDLVTRVYELTLSRDVPVARAATEQCAAFTAASAAQAQGAYADAVQRYQDYRQAYPATVLAPHVHDNLMRTYVDWAGSLRSAHDYPAAIQVYRDLLVESNTDPVIAAAVRGEIAATYFEQAEGLRATLPTASGALRVEQARSAIEALLVIQREFGDTTTGPKVPQAIVDTFTTANSLFTDQRFCDALPVLDYFVTLPPAEAGGVLGPANADRPRAMLECGFERYRAANYSGAITQLDQFLATYPESPQAAQARSAIIAAKVAAEVGESLPLPAPLGDNSPGDNAVTFYNDSPLEVRVLVAGPTAHEFTLPPCPGCPASYRLTEDACPTFAGKPSMTLRLRPGTYHMVGTYPADPSVEKLVDTYVVQSGFDYTSCLHIQKSSPFDRLPRYEPLVPIEPLPVPR